MDWSLFTRIARECREAGVEEVGLFYLGESFAAPDLLLDAVRYCKRNLGVPYVFLTTNGSLAHPDIVYDVMAAGLDSLKWSVNAADAEQFTLITGAKAALFETALRHLRSAREVRDANGFPCRLSASSIRYDGAQHERMERLLTERVRPYADEHYWLPLYSMASQATEREAELGYRPIAGNRGRLGALRDPLPCWAVFTAAHVTAAGILSACCFDADGRFGMADLTRVSFREGWHSAAFRAIRAAHLVRDVRGTPCDRCVAYG